MMIIAGMFAMFVLFLAEFHLVCMRNVIKICWKGDVPWQAWRVDELFQTIDKSHLSEVK